MPGNARIDEAGIAERIARYYAPYDAAIEAAIEAAVAAGHPPAIVSLHSFTPFWKGVPRPWHAGVLWDREGRLAQALIAQLQAEGDLIVGDNEPYHGGLPGDTIDRHATRRGLLDALIEHPAGPDRRAACGARLGPEAGAPAAGRAGCGTRDVNCGPFALDLRVHPCEPLRPNSEEGF